MSDIGFLGLNKVILVGAVSQPPELIQLKMGASILSLKIETHERWKNKEGEPQLSTERHNITIFSALSKNLIHRVSMGDVISVVGRLRTRKIGERYITDVYASEVEIIGRVQARHEERSHQSNPVFQGPTPEDAGALPGQDIPF